MMNEKYFKTCQIIIIWRWPQSMQTPGLTSGTYIGHDDADNFLMCLLLIFPTTYPIFAALDLLINDNLNYMTESSILHNTKHKK